VLIVAARQSRRYDHRHRIRGHEDSDFLTRNTAPHDKIQGGRGVTDQSTARAVDWRQAPYGAQDALEGVCGAVFPGLLPVFGQGLDGLAEGVCGRQAQDGNDYEYDSVNGHVQTSSWSGFETPFKQLFLE
jgi:hypothetical protein